VGERVIDARPFRPSRVLHFLDLIEERMLHHRDNNQRACLFSAMAYYPDNYCSVILKQLFKKMARFDGDDGLPAWTNDKRSDLYTLDEWYEPRLRALSVIREQVKYKLEYDGDEPFNLSELVPIEVREKTKFGYI